MKKAVALSYPEGADAPFITAKGKGAVAERILEIAREHNVHIEQNALLNDVLSVYDAGSYVPPETYEILAKLFAYIKHMNT